jgi:acyl carrier protein
MDRELFYRRLSEILEISPEQFAAEGRRLQDTPDSVVLLEIMALVDEMSGVTLTPEALTSARSADAIIELAVNCAAQ